MFTDVCQELTFSKFSGPALIWFAGRRIAALTL